MPMLGFGTCCRRSAHGALLVRLDDVHAPDLENPDVARLRDGLLEQGSAGQAQDLFQFFVTDVQNRAGLEIDQAAINAVNAQFQ